MTTAWLATIAPAAPLTLAAAFLYWALPLFTTYLSHPIQEGTAAGFVAANLVLAGAAFAQRQRRSPALATVAVGAWCVAVLGLYQFGIGGATRVVAMRHGSPALYWAAIIAALAFPLVVLAPMRQGLFRRYLAVVAAAATLAVVTPVPSFHSRFLADDEDVRTAVRALLAEGEQTELARAEGVWAFVSNRMAHRGGSILRSPDQILRDGTGTCGSASKLLASAMRAAGFATRIVNVVGGAGGGHVVVEAWVEGKWRMYDADLKRLIPDEDNPDGVAPILRANRGAFPGTPLQRVEFQFLTQGGYIPVQSEQVGEQYGPPSEGVPWADLPGSR